MLTEEILKHPTSILTEVQRSQYFERGFLVLPDYVPHEWLVTLRAAKSNQLPDVEAVKEANMLSPGQTIDHRYQDKNQNQNARTEYMPLHT